MKDEDCPDREDQTDDNIAMSSAAGSDAGGGRRAIVSLNQYVLTVSYRQIARQ